MMKNMIFKFIAIQKYNILKNYEMDFTWKKKEMKQKTFSAIFG
jgi:hypothetical protein